MSIRTLTNFAACLSAIIILAGSTFAAESPADPPSSSGVPATLDRVLSAEELGRLVETAEGESRWRPYRVDLAPARWIWLPSQRTLPNSFVLFRREVDLKNRPKKASGWITADSRYRLTVNGRRVQWGPAPCDPRNLDVDPIDLTAYLSPGKNVIGVEVLYYGYGEGTWAAGKPGMIFNLAIECDNGENHKIVSDKSWLTKLDRAHRPGQFKRWFLRSLQEEFDARRHPYGWDKADFKPDADWVAAAELRCWSNKPAACGSYRVYDSISRADPSKSSLRMRQIPLMRESKVPAMRLAESGRVDWKRDPNDWFEFRMPDSFQIERKPIAEPLNGPAWRLLAADGPRDAVFAMFEFKEQIVGWPYFTIEAPEGTIVELICQESHDPAAAPWLDTQYFNWSRFVCRKGVNRFEAFDFESLRWLQLHVRNAAGPVVIRDVGIRRRAFDWPNSPQIRCSDPTLQRLFDAAVNTLCNSAQETCVDGMGRERQQYSGDGGHQLISARNVFGERRQSARFLRTFSEGLTRNGYFMDSWPGFDRLARIMQREMDGALWGPLLDHGVGFNFDCWKHYWETGDIAALDEPYPRLVVFAEYLHSIRDRDGLMPVEDIGIPVVWMDHVAYRRQRHKQCSFTLYVAAMYEHALAPIARARGDLARAKRFALWGKELRQNAVRKFWSAERGLFVDNLPWLAEDKSIRLSDRTLATAVLFDQCPDGNTAASLRALVDCPAEMGLSYPCNACWRYWALARLGRSDVVLDDLRRRWAVMKSVELNNSIQENWQSRPDSSAQWSHAAMAPLLSLYNDIAGIRATAPGFARCQIRPQLADLDDLDLTYYTVRGPLRFTAERLPNGNRRLAIRIPKDCEAELLLPDGEKTTLPRLAPKHPGDLKRYQLKSGTVNEFDLSYIDR